jgi:hypothetical protein
MKRLICLIAVAYWVNLAQAQTKLEKVVPVKSGENVNMDFTWPELISIKTWDRDEIKLVASVDINKGQNNDAFIFEVNNNSSGITIASLIKGYKGLPKKIMIMQGGQEYFFDTDDTKSPEVRKFKKEHPGSYEYMNYGVITEITLEVWVPKSIKMDIYSKFGLIEVSDFTGDMKIHSKFGGVDVSSAGNTAIKAGTRFGEKYTNLDSPMESIALGNSPGKWDWVMLGNGNPKQEVKSDFGNVYLRKQ